MSPPKSPLSTVDSPPPPRRSPTPHWHPPAPNSCSSSTGPGDAPSSSAPAVVPDPSPSPNSFSPAPSPPPSPGSGSEDSDGSSGMPRECNWCRRRTRINRFWASCPTCRRLRGDKNAHDARLNKYRSTPSTAVAPKAHARRKQPRRVSPTLSITDEPSLSNGSSSAEHGSAQGPLRREAGQPTPGLTTNSGHNWTSSSPMSRPCPLSWQSTCRSNHLGVPFHLIAAADSQPQIVSHRWGSRTTSPRHPRPCPPLLLCRSRPHPPPDDNPYPGHAPPSGSVVTSGIRASTSVTVYPAVFALQRT